MNRDGIGRPPASLKYEFFTPYHRGFDLLFDFLCHRPERRFAQGPLSIRASYGYERARIADVFAEDQYVGTAHSFAERFADIAPTYQRFMRLVETSATEWAAECEAQKQSEADRYQQEDAALCARVLVATGNAGDAPPSEGITHD